MRTFIPTIHLFPTLDNLLIELLHSLSNDDWQHPTLAGQWTIKDIAAHLLDGNLRTLSMLRDGYFGEQPGEINSYQDLVDFLDGLNADWVKAMRRLSPGVLIELLHLTGKQYTAYLESLDPNAKAVFSVAWAGEQESLNWFHIAREYTEKWHHQQQIRLATGQEAPLYTRELYHPYLETSMRALPHHYRDTPAPDGACICFHITGEAGGDWYLLREADHWALSADCPATPVCDVVIDGEIAWRLFTKGISRKEAEARVQISGRQELGGGIFGMLAIMG